MKYPCSHVFLSLGDARSRCSIPAIPIPLVPPPLGSSPLPGRPRSLCRGLLQKYRSGLAEVGEEMSERESTGRQSQDREDGLSQPRGAQGPAVEQVNGKGWGLQRAPRLRPRAPWVQRGFGTRPLPPTWL